MHLEFVQAAGFEIALYSWGTPGKPVVLCVHGLGGQGQAFATIANYLSTDFQVLAVDLIGRGRSQWSTKPEEDYTFQCYEDIILDLLSQRDIDQLHWLGVSMGGALGIRLGGSVLRDQVKSLILNDIGQSLDEQVAARIHEAVSAPIHVPKFLDLVDIYEQLFGAFGMAPSDGRSWQDMALESSRRSNEGGWTLHFDPQVADQLRYALEDYSQADAFANILAPILVFRGAKSDVLTQTDLAAMMSVQSNLQVEQINDVGHAPLLDRPEDLSAIKAFLIEAEGHGAEATST